MSSRLLLALGLGPLCLGAACSNDRALPDGFVMGTAVAGFQVDMGCPTIPAEQCEDRRSDWYAFVTSTVTRARASNYLSGDPVSSGPGFYELYEQDLDRVKDLGLGAFRFSVEWSRVFPESTVGIEGHEALKARASAAGLDYYKRQLAALRARGLHPLVTLHHYTLPLWMHDAVGCNQRFATCSPKGWLEPAVVAEMAKYAGFVARELGGEVDEWATLNEPLQVAIPGFLFQTRDRTNPPAQTVRFSEAKTAMIRMIHAHAAIADAVRANDTADADGDGKAALIGLVHPIALVVPKDPASALDQRAARNVTYLYNEVFLNGVLNGVLDEKLDRSGVSDPTLVGRSDYLGLNYYFQITVAGENDSLDPDFSPLLTINPLELKPGGPYPRGIYEGIRYISEKYPGVPLVITENGADVAVEGGQEKFAAEHLQWVLRAVKEGADVRGYYWWSLMDNYEWNQGTGLKFGLYAVDPADRTKARVERPVAGLIRRIAAEREVPSDASPIGE